MQVYPEKLAAELERGHHPVYVVSGDEPLLVQEASDQIRGALRARGFSERELYHADATFDWDQVLFNAGSLSLFGDRKILEVRLPTGKPGDKGAKALVTLAGQARDGVALLLIAGRLDGRSKWYKALDSAGATVSVWPLDAQKFPGWLGQRLRAAGLSADPDAVEMLAERLEGNLLAAVQEIERLRLTVGKKRIDVDTVMAGVSDSSRFDVFLLIDAALGGDAARALRIAGSLRAEGAEPLFLVAMLAREVRTLHALTRGAARGIRPDALFKKHRVWAKRQSVMKAALRQHTPVSTAGLARRLGRVDRAVKGLLAADPWTELRSLVAELAGVPLGLDSV